MTLLRPRRPPRRLLSTRKNIYGQLIKTAANAALAENHWSDCGSDSTVVHANDAANSNVPRPLRDHNFVRACNLCMRCHDLPQQRLRTLIRVVNMRLDTPCPTTMGDSPSMPKCDVNNATSLSTTVPSSIVTCCWPTGFMYPTSPGKRCVSALTAERHRRLANMLLRRSDKHNLFSFRVSVSFRSSSNTLFKFCFADRKKEKRKKKKKKKKDNVNFGFTNRLQQLTKRSRMIAYARKPLPISAFLTTISADKAKPVTLGIDKELKGSKSTLL